MKLSGRVRKIMLWITVAVVGVAVVAAMVSVLRILIRPQEAAQAFQIAPSEVTLCIGQEVTFSVEPPVSDVEWAVTGGSEIGLDGHYVAGDIPGSYVIQAAGPRRGQQATALVYVVACTPTPTATPIPTPVPTPTPTSVPTPIPALDAEGDVGVYSSGAPVAQPPAGIDISNAAVSPEGRVILQGGDIPAELSGWLQEGEALLWISLHQPAPVAYDARADWLFALDLDGDVTTGRPVGSARINPDLGMEVALGVYYDPTGGNYETYLLIWDSTQGDWADGADVVRFTFSENRTLVGLAIPLDTLAQQVSQIAGVTIAPESVTGRVGAVVYTSPEAVIDFYPDLPE
jgi:hypothetical protein